MKTALTVAGLLLSFAAGIGVTLAMQNFILWPLARMANTQQQIVEQVFPKLGDLERRLGTVEQLPTPRSEG